MSNGQFIPGLRRISTITQSSLRYIYLEDICTPDMYGAHDDLYKALGSKSMRDFYDKAAYYGSDSETELTDDDANNDTESVSDADTDSDASSVEDIDDNRVPNANNTFKTAIQPVLTKHPGFPNLRYLHLGGYLGSAKLRYFCRQAEGRDPDLQFLLEKLYSA